MSLDWLRAVAQQPANHYEEVEVDHRAKDPLLKALKKRIRLQHDMVQCQEIRQVLPGCLGWERFVEAWKPCDLILTSILKVRDRAQKLLFERLEEYFLETSVPLLYRPEDTRRQNIIVTIPGPSLEGSVIGKFTQGSVTDGKRLTRRLVIDLGSSISWSVTHGKVAPWWEHPKSAPWGISSIIMIGPNPSTPT